MAWSGGSGHGISLVKLTSGHASTLVTTIKPLPPHLHIIASSLFSCESPLTDSPKAMTRHLLLGLTKLETSGKEEW